MSKKIYKIGIRQEDYKNYESRTPLTPSDIADLLQFQHKGLLEIYVQKTILEERKVNAIYFERDGNRKKKPLVTQLPRCFSNDDFIKAGAFIVDEFPHDVNVIIGIKEIPCHDYFDSVDEKQMVIKNGFEASKAYAYFSHTFKGQAENEDMFMEMIEKKCTLVDYEMIVENASEFKFNKARKLLSSKMAPAACSIKMGAQYLKFLRTVYFGKFAGIVGAINSLWVLGLRLDSEGIYTPFKELNQAKSYRGGNQGEDLDIGDHHRNVHDYDKAKEALEKVAKKLKSFTAPENCPPFIIGITGKSLGRSEKSHSLVLGHSAIGAKEVIDIFDPISIDNPNDLLSEEFRSNLSRNKVYVVYFDETHTLNGNFEKYFPKLTVLLNCLTWKPGTDRIVTSNFLKNLYANNLQNWHRVIGDISCDPGGSIEICKDIYSADKYYIYETDKDNDPSLRWTNDEPNGENNFDELFDITCTIGKHKGNGPVITSITNFPCELPKESSREFSYMLKDFVFDLAKLSDAPDTFREFYEEYDIARPIKRAVMIYKGKVTPDYAYLIDEYQKLKIQCEKSISLWV